MILVKVEEKPKYKTIKINLSQAAVRTQEKPVEKAQEKPQQVQETVAEAKPVETTPPKESAPQKSVDTPKQASAPKKAESVKKSETPKKAEAAKNTEPKKAETAAKPKENVDKAEKVTPTLVKSQEQLMAEAAANKKQASFDDFDPFADDDEPQVDWSQVVASNNNSNSSSIEGSAAASSQSQSAPQTSSSRSQEKSASANTNSALAGLKSVSATTAGRVSTIQVGSSTSSDKVTIKTDDGRVRELLSPAKPEIRLSEENARKITGTVKVNIIFKIYADGTVPATFVRFTPASVLPPEVQDEIKNIIRQWRFVSDTSEATATLEYTIQVN